MIPPTMALRAATDNSRFDCLAVDSVKQIMDKGASFCHVDRRRAFAHDREVITEGYQKWHGVLPSLISIENVSISELGVSFRCHIEILAKSISADPSACARKYLIAASDSWFDFEYSVIGTNLSILISSIHHMISQFDLAKTMIVLVSIIDSDRIENGV